MPSSSASGRHGSRKATGYVPSKLSRVNEDDNQGLNRIHTDHPPAATALVGRQESKASNKGLNRLHTDHLPAVTAVVSRHTSKRNSTLGPEQYSVNPSRKSSTRATESRPPLHRLGSTKVGDLTRVSSTHAGHGTSRAPTAATSKYAGSETYGATQAIAMAHAPSSSSKNAYGPTTLKTYDEVTTVSRAPQPSRTVRDPSALIFIEALKAKFGRGKKDPRSLDEIMENKNFEGTPVRPWLIDELGLSPRDRRPLELIVEEHVQRMNGKGFGNGKRTLKRQDSFSSDEDCFSDDDRDLGMSLRTIMPRGTGNGKKKGRVSRLVSALKTHVSNRLVDRYDRY